MTDAASIDAWLPQTQCTRCGYADCRAYAEAIVRNETTIDRCPPGGDATLRGLADLLGRSQPERIAADLDPFPGYRVAVVVETECIGCTRCIAACPVDAIVGSGKSMHTVIEALCTGCELCIPPCPVDCIRLQAPNIASAPDATWPDLPEYSSSRFRAARQRRRSRLERADGRRPVDADSDPDEAAIRREILAAVARRRARRDHAGGNGKKSWTKSRSR